MTTLTKMLLGISLAAFAMDITTGWVWGFSRPVGAIFLGLAMISKMLETVTAEFDADEKERLARAEKVLGAKSSTGEDRHAEPFRAAA